MESKESGSARVRTAVAKSRPNAWVPGAADPEPAPTDYTRPLRELLRAVGRNRMRLAAAILAGVLLGFGAGFVRKARYEARTTLEMEGLNENFLNIRDVNPTSITGLYTPEAYLQTQARILQSDSLLRRVAKELDLASTREFGLSHSRMREWLNRWAPSILPPIAPEEHTVNQMRLALAVESTKETRIVEVAVRSKDPVLAARIANQLAQDYIDSLLDARWDMYQRTADRLLRQLAELRKQVEVAGNTLRDYSRNSGLVFTEAKDRDTLPEETLRQIQADLTRAQTERITTQAQYEVTSKAPEGTLGEVSGNTPLQQYEKDLVNLRRQLAAATVAMKPAHPAVKKLQSDIAVLEGTIAREREALLARTRQAYESSRRREQMLADTYRTYSRTVADQSDKITQYKLLKHELETTQAVHDSMFQKVKEAGLAAALRTTNVRVVDPAVPPSRPYWPNHILNTAVGLVAGIFLGLLWVFGREYGSGRIRYPGQLWAQLSLPEVGCIPAIKRIAPKRSSHKIKITAPPAGQVLLDAPPAFQESIRSLGPSLMFAADHGVEPAVLMLTSLGANEGKTTLTAGVGAAITESGKRVLLIDGDLRNPRLHEILDVSAEPGFADLLDKHQDFSSVPLDEYIRPTAIPGLSVMTAGKTGPASARWLYSPRLAALLDRCSKEFEMVIVDSPPLNTPESRALGRASTDVVLVVRADTWDVSDIRTAVSLLQADRIPLAGAILNRFAAQRAPHWYPYRSITDAERAV